MKTVEEINELAYKRYGCDPHSFGGQRDGFKEGFKQAQEMQLLQSCVMCSLCDGNGYTIDIAAECCGMPDEDGYCCGVPSSIQVQKQCNCDRGYLPI